LIKYSTFSHYSNNNKEFLEKQYAAFEGKFTKVSLPKMLFNEQ
jgi:hypothetical protein